MQSAGFIISVSSLVARYVPPQTDSCFTCSSSKRKAARCFKLQRATINICLLSAYGLIPGGGVEAGAAFAGCPGF
jgi:hypothetical protein